MYEYTCKHDWTAWVLRIAGNLRWLERHCKLCNESEVKDIERIK